MIQKYGEYKNICNDIKIYEGYLNYYERKKKWLITAFEGRPSGYKAIEYSDMPKARGARMPLDQGYEEVIKIEPKIIELQRIVNGMKKTRDKIDNYLDGLTGDDNKVMYKRIVEGKSIQCIADELYCGTRTVDRIIARNKGCE